MSLLKKIKRLAGLPDISQLRIREFILQAGPMVQQSAIPTDNCSLAIVVPCFGHIRFLKSMLDSITSQTRLPDEVILIDDCSPDSSGDFIEQFIHNLGESLNSRFRLIRNSANKGQAASLNIGISAAASDMIMILNDDDYLMHDAVETAFNLFNRHRNVVLIGGSSIHFSEENDFIKANKTISSFADINVTKFDIRYPSDVLNYHGYNDLNITHSGSCFLKFAWEKVGGYYSDKQKRLVPFSDRDFQLRVNALFPVAVSSNIPFSFWRSNSSVDAGRNT